MLQTFIFDLSEVLISGIIGIESKIAERTGETPDSIFRALGGDLLHELCCGNISEDQYLTGIRTRQGWDLDIQEAKVMIRQNFHNGVPGMESVLTQLSGKYKLILLSDHAKEWIEYIRPVHPFLDAFDKQFYSFELKQTKRDPSTFQRVLKAIDQQPSDCLFIDDSPSNIRVAASLGIPGIQFTSAHDLTAQLQTYNIWVTI